jgi:hypothetical protein
MTQPVPVIEFASAKAHRITTYNDTVTKLRTIYGRCGPALLLLAIAEVIRDDQSWYARRLSPILDTILDNVFIAEV